MSIAESLLPEYDHEMASTRKMLEAIPNDQLAFKPHEKCNEMAGLVTHLVTVPGWGADTIKTDSLDFTGYTPPPAVKSREEAIEIFDKGSPPRAVPSLARETKLSFRIGRSAATGRSSSLCPASP